MDLATDAFKLKKKNPEEAMSLFKKAYELEKEAAMSFINDNENPFNRSVLFRSAASIAMNAKMKKEALLMCKYGLETKDIPTEIKQEIDEIINTVGNELV